MDSRSYTSQSQVGSRGTQNVRNVGEGLRDVLRCRVIKIETGVLNDQA